MTLRLKAFADKDDPRLWATNDNKQVVIKPARVGAVAAFAAAFVVSYLTAVSYLVVRGGQSPIETLGTVLDRFLTGNYSSSAGTKLKADQSSNKSTFAPGGGIKRAKPGQSREVSRQPEPLPESNRAPDSTVRDAGQAARGESPTAFGRRCIPSGCVAPPSNIPDILGRHALPAGRIAGLGATPDFHHGLPGPIAVTAAPAPPPAPLRRTISYLPGQRSEWIAYDLDVDTPRIIRAAGQISIGKDVSHPSGLRDSKYERGLRRQSKPGWNKRALPSAPYLALIGRVCSDRICSEPFFVGTSAVVCPSDTVGRVQLQLRTNQYVLVDGMPTLSSAHVFGGFSIYAEAAPADDCGDRSGVLPVSHDVTPMASGEVLRGPELRVSTNQIWWKPFIVPLRQPLLIRASGQVQPRRGATATGPNGIAVPDAPQWFYPGTPAVVVDNTHKLYQRALPYQALIGRLCGMTECGPAFLVGDERLVCAKSPHDDHLELWINHIVGPSEDTFELLQGHGEYRFELSGAPSGACAPTVTMK